MDAVIRAIEQIVTPEDYYINEPMSNHTTFRIGGIADVFVMPKNKEELVQLLYIGHFHHQPITVIGNGSNLLVSDKGIRGIVIQTINMRQIEVKDQTTLVVGPGAKLKEIGEIALENRLAGFEFAYGIPGTIGGALITNAGAYDGEMSNIVKCVQILPKTLSQNEMLLNYKMYNNEQLQFGYRYSILQQIDAIVTEVTIGLQRGNTTTIKAKMNDLEARRWEKQPMDLPSAGSIFKRPEGYYTGKLIDDCGLRGYQIGGAQISDKHCGFIVNKENATAQDVVELIRFIQTTLKERYNVTIETEVRMIGEW